jgi:pimeloyl-ACP methyl ester carboxylesterase
LASTVAIPAALRTSLADLARLDVPALLMNGTDSPASGRAATERIAYALPRSRRHEFAGMGHMGPLVKPEVVNGVIEEFLESLSLRRRAVAAAVGAVPAWLAQAYAA